MKKKILAGLLMLTLVVSMVGCGSKDTQETVKEENQQAQSEEKTYQYYTAKQVKEAIKNGDDITLVDIQVEEEWNAHHIKGAISTKAYPVENDEQKANIDAVIPKLEGENLIIVVCPGGKLGAQRTVDYLNENGISAERLFILENGQGGWPYDELLESKENTYKYYTAEQVKEAIENGDDITLVDIQVEKEWNAHHIKGAISTKAYPVKTDEERAKVDTIIPQLEGENPIIVVCPGGKGGAQRTVNHLNESGISAERLFILENGQGGWPYDELLEK